METSNLQAHHKHGISGLSERLGRSRNERVKVRMTLGYDQEITVRLAEARMPEPVKEAVLEKATLKVVERSPLDQPGCLEEPLVRRFGKLARKVERLFGGPQDIEWAVADGQIFLLQARPVTATRPARSGEDRQVWSNINSGEVAPDMMTPATWSMILLAHSPRRGRDGLPRPSQMFPGSNRKAENADRE